MTKQEFMDSLKWVVGPAPTGRKSHYFKDAPMICESVQGYTFVVGDQNFDGGTCDHCDGCAPDEVVRYAMLWDE